MVTQLNGRKAPIRLITFRRDVKVEQIKNKLNFMKTLDLSKCGLVELNLNEKIEKFGGDYFAVGRAIAVYMYNYYNDQVNAGNLGASHEANRWCQIAANLGANVPCGPGSALPFD